MTDPSSFSVTVETAPPEVRVVGELDMATSGALADAIAALVDGPPGPPLVFDLTEVSFMDSSGLAVLLEAANAEHAVVIRGANETVRRVIEATGLDGVLKVEP